MIDRLQAFVKWVSCLPIRFWKWCCGSPDDSIPARVAEITEEVDQSVREARVSAKVIQRRLRLGIKGDMNNMAIAEAVLREMSKIERRHE